MRISDWSSDVCSSDLIREHGLVLRRSPVCGGGQRRRREAEEMIVQAVLVALGAVRARAHRRRSEERGSGKSVSVRVDLGGRRIIKKNRKKPHKLPPKQYKKLKTKKTTANTKDQ